MKTTTLGGRLRISSIGLGCATFGREIDESAAHLLLDCAVAKGITFFDTAVSYGEGVSESIVGAWFASRRPPAGSLTLATKISPPYLPARIAEAVDGCLRRLRVPAIDLLFLHRWDATAESPATLAALDTLVRAGKVRMMGACNYSREELGTGLALQAQHGLESFRVAQNNHHLAVSDISPEFRKFCVESGIAIVTYSPLGAGFLTGKHRHGVQPGSRFDRVPGHQSIYFREAAIRRLGQLERVAARAGQDQARLALAWALHQPDVASVLVGGRTPAHIDQALAAQDFDEPALFAELDAEPPPCDGGSPLRA